MQRPAGRFDRQARAFDERAGVGTDVARSVAGAVLDLVGSGTDALVVELGAGTGEIGRHLAPCVDYLGLDRSRPMLDVFRAKLVDVGAVVRAGLVQADAEDGWPVRTGAATAVFAGRVAHLLHRDHVVAEIRRVCRPGGLFLVGRVERDPDSPKSRLRRQRRQLLRGRGVEVADGNRATESLLDRLVGYGGARLDQRTAAGWSASTSIEHVLDGWEAMTSMGGVVLPATVRESVLGELRTWARHEYGGLGEVLGYAERYVLDGVRL